MSDEKSKKEQWIFTVKKKKKKKGVKFENLKRKLGSSPKTKIESSQGSWLKLFLSVK